MSFSKSQGRNPKKNARGKISKKPTNLSRSKSLSFSSPKSRRPKGYEALLSKKNTRKIQGAYDALAKLMHHLETSSSTDHLVKQWGSEAMEKLATIPGIDLSPKEYSPKKSSLVLEETDDIETLVKDPAAEGAAMAAIEREVEDDLDKWREKLGLSPCTISDNGVHTYEIKVRVDTRELSMDKSNIDDYGSALAGTLAKYWDYAVLNVTDKMRKYLPHWQEEDRCFATGNNFNAIRWRHNCRFCGHQFCSSAAPLSSDHLDPFRICSNCSMLAKNTFVTAVLSHP